MNLLFQSPTFKFSRKASSSYSLRLESGRQKDQRNMSGKVTRRTNSTPASPSHGGHGSAGHHHTSTSTATAGGAAGSGGSREPQCTCMTPEQYARLRAQDPRFRGQSGKYKSFSDLNSEKNVAIIIIIAINTVRIVFLFLLFM